MSALPPEALECPRCGAALPMTAAAAAVECSYCKSVVVPRPKPAPVHVIERVVERVVVQSPSAPGTDAPRRAPRAPRTPAPGVLLCPRCVSKLFGANTGAMTIHGCGMCGGIWLDNAASKVVVERMEPIALDLADSASSRAQHTVDKTETGIPCAVCGQAMQRTRVAEATVDVDICPEHGTWFDCDEMQRVMRSFDRARWSRSRVERPEQDIDEWARQVRGTDWKESDAVAILGGVAAALAAGAAVDPGGSRRR